MKSKRLTAAVSTLFLLIAPLVLSPSCKEDDPCETHTYADPVIELVDTADASIVVRRDSLYNIRFLAEAEAGLNTIVREQYGGDYYDGLHVYTGGETEDNFSLSFMSWQDEEIRIFLYDMCNRSDEVSIKVHVVDTIEESGYMY